MPSRTTSGAPLALLAILDGWGLRAEREANAVALARTPVMDRLARTCPMTTLDPHGEAVGLPPGQMGNSEVGHLNIGAGRVVYQDIMRINRAIASGEFFENAALRELIGSVQGASDGTLHLVGLVSDGGVHSHIEHLFALLELCRRAGVRRVAVHALTDGRDTSPTSGREHVARLAERIALTPGARIATICGRYYAMDRDKRWERTAKAWSALVLGEGAAARDPVAAIEASYAAGKTDEFILPIVLEDESGAPVARIKDGDAVFIFNFRADRVRQIARALYEPAFDGFERREFPKLRIATMTQYSAEFPFPVAFPEHRMEKVLGEVFGDHGIANLRIAETEKYAHVTYFFNGGEEKGFPGEERILVPSPKVATYDLQPEMSASEVTDRLVREIEARRFRAVILNYANPDMVGHTGILEAAINAVETVDTCLGRVLAAVESVGGAAIVTADHGNCETMVDPVTGGPHTAHTTNPVPCLLVGTGRSQPLRGGGSLCDLAPTMLEILGLPQPRQMTGTSLLARSESRA
jgi:2,3-bisphosphoglycerate-independent phosphoglycerate mutase